ncbi:uncharacterized protein FFM5_09989 [Fusarium fujikuroi]|nr:uncharacterized protein FFM5_09989 [Fusarium fujikuroi]
MAIINISLL